MTDISTERIAALQYVIEHMDVNQLWNHERSPEKAILLKWKHELTLDFLHSLNKGA
tara:strand:- start:9246 stop:9413 length:168 start_codon:yes stop_codon:yes gene_type:complete